MPMVSKKQRPRIQLRRRLPLFLLLVLLLLALLIPSRVWTILSAGLGGLLAIAYVWARQLASGLGGHRQLRFGWVSVGDRLSEQFTIVNRSPLPALWVELLDESDVPGYQAAVVRSVSADTADQWRTSAICTRRGQYRLGPWALRSGDPFGIFEITLSYSETEQIVIHPPIYSRVPIPLPAGQSSGRARTRSTSWQASINAAGVRSYHPPDPQQWIHWPTTARRDELFVRQFDLDAGGDIWLVLDLQKSAQLGQGVDSTEEYAVLLAAALSAQALAQSRSIGLVTYGRRPQLVVPNHGEGQQWKILQALAVLTANGQNDLARTLKDFGQITRRGSAAIIITPTGQVEWLPELLSLAQNFVQPHVLLLDRASFGGDNASQALRNALGDLGFGATLARRGDLGDPLEQLKHRGYWEFRVTGTGKAVTIRSPFEP